MALPAPVIVSIDVPQPIGDVFAYLDVMANHEAFTDHYLTNWRLSGPASGSGARAAVTSKLAGQTDEVEIEVIEADPPTRSTERNISAGGKRRATGTYTLEPLDAGGTRITFTYAWDEAPLGDRLLPPLTRWLLIRANRTVMVRLAEQLAKRA
jgi:hypothetical protein